MGELWALLDSAQNSPNGIPEELVAMKMDEIKGRKVGSCHLACLNLKQLEPFSSRRVRSQGLLCKHLS